MTKETKITQPEEFESPESEREEAFEMIELMLNDLGVLSNAFQALSKACLETIETGLIEQHENDDAEETIPSGIPDIKFH